VVPFARPWPRYDENMRIRFLAAVDSELGDLPGDVVGVGPVVAAANATALMCGDRPSAIILVGTAGAYPGGPPVGSVIVASRLGLGDGAARAGLGYVPIPPPTIDGDLEWLESGLPRAKVLTTTAITTDPALAGLFARDGWEVEHLEAYGVALACSAARVPFAVVLGIANQVGPTAHAEWSANRSRVQDAVRQIARTLIR
jgi:futalosine hydrolase